MIDWRQMMSEVVIQAIITGVFSVLVVLLVNWLGTRNKQKDTKMTVDKINSNLGDYSRDDKVVKVALRDIEKDKLSTLVDKLSNEKEQLSERVTKLNDENKNLSKRIDVLEKSKKQKITRKL